uniref:Reverse transcriptase Ty1/copia-type domain-containing protein n=1 Tax=Peronospora matthiolae TaxID=2874970 RepID=A0AAV1UC00_9STRA
MCLYRKQDDEDVVVAGVYVDNLLATGTSVVAVDHFFASLGSLSIKDFSRVLKFLGMRVALDGDGFYIMDQEEAIKDLLREHGLNEANPTLASIGADCYEVQDEDSALLGETSTATTPSIKNFRSLVGSLLWVAHCTRPDVAFAVHKATRQTHRPRVHDWKLAKRIARYLKGTQGLKLKVKPRIEDRDTPTLESYSEADSASDKKDRKSSTGSIILRNGMLLNWSAKKQGGVSLSIMEEKFAAASEASRNYSA